MFAEGGSDAMKKRISVIILCVILLAVSMVVSGCGTSYPTMRRRTASGGLLAVSMSLGHCEPEIECEPMTSQELLEHTIDKINEKLVAICMGSRPITYDQLKTALASFYYIQDEYSGKKMVEIEGVEYYYPLFVLEWVNREIDKEGKLFYITTLEKSALGIYTGIRVSPWYGPEAAEKIKEMNGKLMEFLIYTTDRNKVDEMAERYKQFQQEYSGKLLCVDPDKGEIYCPEYTYWIDDIVEKYGRYQLWQSKLDEKNVEGFITGISVFTIADGDDKERVLSTGEVLRWKQPDVESPDLVSYADQGPKNRPGFMPTDVPVSFQNKSN